MTALSNDTAGIADPQAREGVAIRRAGSSDAESLERLRQLDTRPLPAGPLLVAEAGGEIRAARSLSTGETISDPFSHTEHLRAMLGARAGALACELPRSRRLVTRWRRRYARAEAV
jgi:hypothetical protein